jgi:RND superfamily putative drug exporter
MQRLMLRIDGVVRRHRRAVLACWLVLVAAAVPFALRQSDRLTADGYAVPGSSSREVWGALERGEFRGAEPAQLAAVLAPQDGAGTEELRSAIARLDAAARRADDVALPTATKQLAVAATARPRNLLVPLRVSVGEDRASNVALGLRDRLGVGDGPRDGIVTHLVGPSGFGAGFQELLKRDVVAGEAIAFPVAMLILLAVFGSLAAATLPVGLGLASVLVTGALIFLISQAVALYVFVTNMASMIGIAVAVDYSLFVFARYRQEIRAGLPPDDARASALATSGTAVVFSGLAVMVSLAGIWIIDSSAIRSLALGAMLVVAVSVLAAATLLPALIGLLGQRVHGSSRLLPKLALRRGGTSLWKRWTARVTRRPLAWGVAASAVLLTLALPALHLELGTGALRELPPGNETRVGFERAAAIGGEGALMPTHVLASFRGGRLGDAGTRETVERLSRRLAADPEIARVDGVVPSRDGRSVLISAIPHSDGESEAAKAMVRRLRSALPSAVEGRRVDLDVGGITAGEQDFQDLISSSAWKAVLLVMSLSYLVLVPLLRSAVLPLKAALLNLLSLAAACGILVAVFQWGWLDGFLGFESPGHVNALALPLVFALVVGLSMDYELFLLLRIRERFDVLGDNRRAVAEGLALSAKTVTSAALIMVAVFAAFVATGTPTIKQIGLGNAVAIALDATLVRLVLVPAAMVLLGRWNWWLPRPLAGLGGPRAAEPTQ